MYDCIIIGGGPAGMSAAIYLIRKKLNILLVTPEFGGQAAKASEIENYLGYGKISGPELLAKFAGQIEDLSLETKSGAEVKAVTKKENAFEVKTADEIYEAKTVLIASGKTPRRLGIPGEEQFIGKGISYCAICDGPLFKDKVVTVIGGGNSALDAAIEIEKHAAKVYILNLNEDFQGDEIRKDHVKNSAKIEVISQAQITEVFGEQFIKGLKYKEIKTGQIKELACEGIFVEIGWMPATDFVKDLVELNELKEIKIDRENQTNVAGIFAAGDVTDVKEKQIIVAAGEGAKAALVLWKYLLVNRMLSK